MVLLCLACWVWFMMVHYVGAMVRCIVPACCLALLVWLITRAYYLGALVWCIVRAYQYGVLFWLNTLIYFGLFYYPGLYGCPYGAILCYYPGPFVGFISCGLLFGVCVLVYCLGLFLWCVSMAYFRAQFYCLVQWFRNQAYHFGLLLWCMNWVQYSVLVFWFSVMGQYYVSVVWLCIFVCPYGFRILVSQYCLVLWLCILRAYSALVV